MPIVHGYCSEQDLREQADDATALLNASLIVRAINAASRAIDRYCGFPRRKFWLDDVPTTHMYEIDDTDGVWIDDVGSATGLIIATDDGGDGSFATVWSPSEYVLLPRNADTSGQAFAWTRIAAVGTRSFPMHRRSAQMRLRVTARHGWSAIPDEVVQACVIKSTSLLKRKDAPFGVAGFGEFGTAVRITREDPDVVDLLGPLRRYGAGSI